MHTYTANGEEHALEVVELGGRNRQQTGRAIEHSTCRGGVVIESIGGEHEESSAGVDNSSGEWQDCLAAVGYRLVNAPVVGAGFDVGEWAIGYMSTSAAFTRRWAAYV